MSLRVVARAVIGKHLLILRQYWLNTLAGLGISYVMFVLVFFTGSRVAPSATEESLSGLIVGFFVWSMAFAAFQDPSAKLMEEAQWGTLEQLYLSPAGIGQILAIRTVFNITTVPIVSGLILAAMMLTTGTVLHVQLGTVFVISMLTICSATGLGFALGGIALVHKRVSNLFLIVQFLFVGAIAAPANVLTNALPLALGYDLLDVAMEGGHSLWELPMVQLAYLVVKALVYLAGGYAVFRYMLGVAKERGVMGHY